MSNPAYREQFLKDQIRQGAAEQGQLEAIKLTSYNKALLNGNEKLANFLIGKKLTKEELENQIQEQSKRLRDVIEKEEIENYRKRQKQDKEDALAKHMAQFALTPEVKEHEAKQQLLDSLKKAKDIKEQDDFNKYYNAFKNRVDFTEAIKDPFRLRAEVERYADGQRDAKQRYYRALELAPSLSRKLNDEADEPVSDTADFYSGLFDLQTPKAPKKSKKASSTLLKSPELESFYGDFPETKPVADTKLTDKVKDFLNKFSPATQTITIPVPPLAKTDPNIKVGTLASTLIQDNTLTSKKSEADLANSPIKIEVLQKNTNDAAPSQLVTTTAADVVIRFLNGETTDAKIKKLNKPELIDLAMYGNIPVKATDTREIIGIKVLAKLNQLKKGNLHPTEFTKKGAINKGQGIKRHGNTKSNQIEMGKFIIDKNLLNNNILSIKHGRTRKKLNGFPNVEISNNLRNYITGNTHGPLTETETRYLSLLHQKAHGISRIPKTSNNPYMHHGTRDLQNKLKIIIGEIENGNTNRELKNELKTVAKLLLERKSITPEMIQQLIEHYLL